MKKRADTLTLLAVAIGDGIPPDGMVLRHPCEARIQRRLTVFTAVVLLALLSLAVWQGWLVGREILGGIVVAVVITAVVAIRTKPKFN